MMNFVSFLRDIFAGVVLGITLLFGPATTYTPRTTDQLQVNNPPPLSPYEIAKGTSTKNKPEINTTVTEVIPKKEVVKTDNHVTGSAATNITPPPTPSPQKVTDTANQNLAVANTPSLPPAEINTRARAAVVNILCINTQAGSLKSITGSGVIIDPKGIILTNAHIAQFILLKDFPKPNSISCVIRTGSPATATYKADLLYISPRWIEENRAKITEETPVGTGEYDYALLGISGTTDGKPLPNTFPYVETQTEDIDLNRPDDQYIVAGYAAGFLGAFTIEWNLYQSSSIASVTDVFTFGTSTVDLLSLSNTIVAQKGASGGGVVSLRNQKLVGLIVTTTDGATTGERVLRAESTSHIIRSFKTETGAMLGDFLDNDPIDAGISFRKNIAPYLSTLLITELTKNQVR